MVSEPRIDLGAEIMDNDSDEWMRERSPLDARTIHALAWQSLKWNQLDSASHSIIEEIMHSHSTKSLMLPLIWSDDIWSRVALLAKRSHICKPKFLPHFDHVAEAYYVVLTNKRFVESISSKPNGQIDYRRSLRLENIRKSCDGLEALAEYVSYLAGVMTFERLHKEAGERAMPAMPAIPELITFRL